MKRGTQFRRAASAVVLGLGLAVPFEPAQARPKNNAESISLHRGTGLNPSVTLENLALVKNVEGANVQPTTPDVVFNMVGKVKCVKDSIYLNSELHFGRLSINPDLSLDESRSLYKVGFEHSGSPNYPNKTTVNHVFKVPLNKIDNGPPSVAFDPVEIFESRLADFVADGGTAAEFMRHDRLIKVPVKLSFAAWCSTPSKPKGLGVNTMGLAPKPWFAEWTDEIWIKYKGDPEISIMNLALKGHNLGQLDHGQPFALTSASFQPNMPHYTGKCPPAQDPKIRVIYSGNGEGALRLRVKEGAVEVYGSQPIAYDSGDGAGFYDFAYPLTGRLQHAAHKNWNALNQTFQHSLVLEIQIKDAKANSWSGWKTFDQAQWRHRCLPQTNVTFGGGLGGFKPDGGPKEMRPAPGLSKPVPAGPSRLQLPAAQPPRAN